MPFMVFACSRKVWQISWGTKKEHFQLTTSAMITAFAENFRPSHDREDYVWFRVTVNRKESQNLQVSVSLVVSTIIQIEAVSDDEQWSSSVRRAASSFDPTIVFVQSPNPSRHSQGVHLQISILENGYKLNCRAKCTSVGIAQYSMTRYLERRLGERV